MLPIGPKVSEYVFVSFIGKHWHVEHFVCAKCEKPFLGNRHYERKGLAYCETHYHQLFGNLCYVCNQVIQGDVFTALNKAWCVNHFACSSCDQKMTVKTKFYEVDLKPVCKKCYDRYVVRNIQILNHHSQAALRSVCVWMFGPMAVSVPVRELCVTFVGVSDDMPTACEKNKGRI
jgi:hypothetical protein